MYSRFTLNFQSLEGGRGGAYVIQSEVSNVLRLIVLGLASFPETRPIVKEIDKALQPRRTFLSFSRSFP